MRKRRKGTLFLQTLVGMGSASLLMLLVTSLIHRSFTFCSDYRKVESNNLTIRNLGYKLRQDLLITQQYKALEPDRNSVGGIELRQLDGTIVQYVISHSSLVRISPKENSESIDSRNTFQLGKNWHAKFITNLDRVELQILKKLPPNDGPTEIVMLRVASQLLTRPPGNASQSASTADAESGETTKAVTDGGEIE